MKYMSKIVEAQSYDSFLRLYLDNKPTFLAIIRAKEASLFNSLLPYRTPVLDFGCGDGFFRKVSLGNSTQIIDIGLEIDQERAQQARQSGIYKNVVVYNGKRIPFPGGTFATVVSNSVLEHIDDLENSIKEVYRVLKNRGTFYVSMMLSDYEDNLLGTRLLGGLYKKWMRKKAYHKHTLSINRWNKYFKKYGFVVEKRMEYLTKDNTRLLDGLQYLSIPAILMQRRLPVLSKLYCRLMRLFLENFLKRALIGEVSTNSCSACFYVLKKKR